MVGTGRRIVVPFADDGFTLGADNLVDLALSLRKLGRKYIIESAANDSARGRGVDIEIFGIGDDVATIEIS